MPLRIPSAIDVQPSPIQIASRSPATASSSAAVCAICHSQSSQYTCPTCNSPYCSLACYKDETRHRACVQAFGQRAEDEVREVSAKERAADEDGKPTAEQREERRKVLDLLRKWQLGGGEGEEGMPEFIRDPQEADSEEDDDEDGASSRSSSPIDPTRLPDSDESLLAMLSDEQRSIFLEAVGRSDTGSSPQTSNNSDRAKMLWDKIVADEHRRNRQAAASQRQQGEGEESAPPAAPPGETANLWWLASPQTTSQPHSDDFAAKLAALQTAQSSSSSPHPAGVGLAWNIVCLLLAYTYTLLHLDVPSFSSVIGGDNANLLSHSLRLMQRLAPFVLPTSTTSEETRLLLDSPSAATAYLLARLGDADRSQRPSALMLELWSKGAHLWAKENAAIVEEKQGAGAASGSKITAALSDIWALCQWGMASKGHLPPGTDKKTLQLAAHKVIFFAAQMSRLATMPASSAPGVSIEEQHVLGLDLKFVLPSREGSSNLDAMSRANGDQQNEGASAAAVMARRRESKTMSDEIVTLRREVEALEDEERQQAAWRLMGGGEQAIDPVVAAPDVKQQTKAARGPVIEVMDAATTEPIAAMECEDNEPQEMARPSPIVEVLDEKAGEKAQPSPPAAAKKSYAELRRSRQERSAPSRLVPSKAAVKPDEE